MKSIPAVFMILSGYAAISLFRGVSLSQDHNK